MTFLELVGVVSIFLVGVSMVRSAAHFLFGQEHAEGE